MQSDFIAEKLKKAKWVLTKNYDVAKEYQQKLEPRVRVKRSWWHRLKLRIFGL